MPRALPYQRTSRNERSDAHANSASGRTPPAALQRADTFENTHTQADVCYYASAPW